MARCFSSTIGLQSKNDRNIFIAGTLSKHRRSEMYVERLEEVANIYANILNRPSVQEQRTDEGVDIIDVDSLNDYESGNDERVPNETILDCDQL